MRPQGLHRAEAGAGRGRHGAGVPGPAARGEGPETPLLSTARPGPLRAAAAPHQALTPSQESAPRAHQELQWSSGKCASPTPPNTHTPFRKDTPALRAAHGKRESANLDGVHSPELRRVALGRAPGLSSYTKEDPDEDLLAPRAWGEGNEAGFPLGPPNRKFKTGPPGSVPLGPPLFMHKKQTAAKRGEGRGTPPRPALPKSEL